MAIIKCKECGKEISEKAGQCPHCGFNYKKTKNKTFKIIVPILVSIVVFILGIILYTIINEVLQKKYELSDENAYEIYEILEKHQTDFKDPSSIIVENASACNNIWTVEIKATNSYGNYTSTKYLIVNDLFLDMNNFDKYFDTNEERLKALNFLLEQKQCIKDGNSIYISEEDINAINERLKRNFSN